MKKPPLFPWADSGLGAYHAAYLFLNFYSSPWAWQRTEEESQMFIGHL